jgi:hypothetical protein
MKMKGKKMAKMKIAQKEAFHYFRSFPDMANIKKKGTKKKKRPFKMPLERTDGAVARQNASKIYRNMGILPNDTQKDL